MTRFARLLVIALVIGLVAAPASLAKPLQPTLPPDARSTPGAKSNAEPTDAAVIVAAGGLAVLFVGAAYPLSRRRVPALG